MRRGAVRVVAVAALTIVVLGMGLVATSSADPLSASGIDWTRFRRPPRTTTTSTTTSTTTTTTVPAGALAVRVSGNHLVDGSGRTLTLHGVNRSGAEYACIQGWGIFDGPVDDASIAAIATWHADVVRVPINEDCWLGINGVTTQYGGTSYRTAITGFVQRLHAQGMYVIIDSHVAAPGTTKSTDILPMADADHAPAMWQSVANTFKADPAVIFDLYNEPHDISWSCWRNGCTVNGYQAAGMQQLVDAVRATGATNPVLIGGIGWSGDPTGWRANAPSDPAGQMVPALHTYDFSPCSSTCKAAFADLATTWPVIAGEIGETDCAHGYIDPLMSWLDSIGAGYLGWTWDANGGWTCTGGPTLITAYDGTPTGFGIGFRDHLLSLG